MFVNFIVLRDAGDHLVRHRFELNLFGLGVFRKHAHSMRYVFVDIHLKNPSPAVGVKFPFEDKTCLPSTLIDSDLSHFLFRLVCLLLGLDQHLVDLAG